MLYIVVDSTMDLEKNRPFVDIIGVYDDVHEARKARDMMLEICRYSKVEQRQHHHYYIFHIPVKNVTKCPPGYDEKVAKDIFCKYYLPTYEIEKGD